MTGLARMCVAIQNLFDFGTVITLAILHRIEEDVEHAADFFADLFQADAFGAPSALLNAPPQAVSDCTARIDKGGADILPVFRSAIRAKAGLPGSLYAEEVVFLM